jgi:hypothetical protein
MFFPRRKLLPFVLVIIGVENTFILTNAVTSTSMELDVKERVGKGLEKVGVSITKNLFTRLFVLFIISTVIDLVQEFCIFTSVAIVIDYLLQMSFFVTTLSIDLRRLEVVICRLIIIFYCFSSGLLYMLFMHLIGLFVYVDF